MGQDTKSCSSFSASILCDGHIYKDPIKKESAQSNYSDINRSKHVSKGTFCDRKVILFSSVNFIYQSIFLYIFQSNVIVLCCKKLCQIVTLVLRISQKSVIFKIFLLIPIRLTYGLKTLIF